MNDVRTEVVAELVDAIRAATHDGVAVIQREIAAAYDRVDPTDAERHAVRQLVDAGQVPLVRDVVTAADAEEPPYAVSGVSVLDLNHRALWTFGQVWNVMRRWWLPTDRRTLGQLLKVVPAEVAQEVTGYLVWAGALDAPETQPRLTELLGPAPTGDAAESTEDGDA